MKVVIIGGVNLDHPRPASVSMHAGLRRFPATRRRGRGRLLLVASCVLAATASGRTPAGDALKKSATQLRLERIADLRLHPRERDLLARELLADREAAVKVLVRNTHASRSVLRQVAAMLLGELGDPRTESPLLALAGGDDAIAAHHARAALVKLYARLPLGKLLARITPAGQQRGHAFVTAAALAAAARVYGRPDSPALPPALVDAAAGALMDPAVGVRAAAAGVLALGAAPRCAQALLQRARRERESVVMVAICRALARLRPVAGVGAGAIRGWRHHGDERVRLEAAAAAWSMGEEPALRDIRTALESHSFNLRLRAARILAASGDADAFEALALAARDIGWRVRLAAVHGFARIQDPGATGVLRGLLADRDARVRAAAAVALHGLGVQGASWALIDDLKSDDTARRIEAARALGELRERRGLPALCTALHDPDLELACSAAEALGRIGGKQAGSELAAALHDHRPALRYWTRQALRAVFGSDPGADEAAWPAWIKEHVRP